MMEGSKDLFLDLHKQDAIDLAQNAEFANANSLQLYNTQVEQLSDLMYKCSSKW